MDAAKVKELKQFVAMCRNNPSILTDPNISFFRDYLESLGAKLPPAAYGSSKSPRAGDAKSPMVDDDDDLDEDELNDDVGAQVHESDDEIVESDIELEGETVEPDNDPPQKMGDPSIEVTEESRDASQESKGKALEALSEGKFDEAVEHLTEAILLNPSSAIMYGTRATVYIKMKKPNAAIRDANAALQINPDSAKGYKARGMAFTLLGKWEEAAKDLHLASKLDYDEEISAMLKKVEPNALEMEKSQRLVLVLLLFVTVGVATEGADYLKYKDPNQPLVVRLNDLISRMTLEEKIGQMAQIDRSNASSDVLKNYFIGSVLYEAVSSPGPQASPKVWVDQVNEMQRAALSTRLGIPIIIGIDAIHGHNTVYNATIFPHNIGLGATRDPALVRKIGAATALEVRATGIPYTFAPCIAVCRDPRWGRCYESYSEDPKIVEMMTEIIPGLQGEIPQNSLKGVPFVAAGKTKVAACAKHYVGDGGTQLGIDENNTIVNFHGLLSIHMPPFYHAIIKGVSTVMVSYSSWNGVKMHANHYLLTDFLKNKLRFRGFIISDYEGVDRITTPAGVNYTYSLQTGILAGIDMIMIPFNYPQYNESFTELVNKGIIPMSRIDDAVRRILRVKFQMGLFENPLGDYSMTSEIGKQEHRDLAREAVRKSLVLLKNGKIHGEPLLPLPKKAKKILVAGSSADNLGYQCGGWTIQWQGVSGNNLTIGTTLLEAIRTTVDVSTEVVYSDSPDEAFIQSNEFSYAIVAVGEHPYAEYFGDSSNLTIADNGPLTIQNVCKHVKCVVVVISGRPVVIEPYVNEIDALVAAWLPGTEGHGMTDALFGDYGFTGKLSKTWFKSVDQLPMNAGDAHYDPLYPFGFGLTTEPLKTTY